MRIGCFEIGHAVRAKDGFADSGDAVLIRQAGERIVLAMIDVLGHGPDAYRLATSSVDLLEASQVNEAAPLLAMLDEALTGTLGAAVGIVAIDTQTGHAQFAGIGNTVARLIGQSERSLVSLDGIVGISHRSCRPIEFVFQPGAMLVMHTDGLSTRFNVADYPQLLAEDVSISARELIRRFGKSYDDAACIVARRAND